MHLFIDLLICQLICLFIYSFIYLLIYLLPLKGLCINWWHLDLRRERVQSTTVWPMLSRISTVSKGTLRRLTLTYLILSFLFYVTLCVHVYFCAFILYWNRMKIISSIWLSMCYLYVHIPSIRILYWFKIVGLKTK